MSEWTLAEIPSQAGRRFFITGANSGVGYAAAVELARHGAMVILACRDLARGEAARRRLQVDAAGPGSAAEDANVVELDLASLESIRDVAEAELSRDEPLHGLINNAGVFSRSKRRETSDGFELQFGTNVLGHFALTCELMPALERGRSAHAEDAPRVVTVASIAHKRGRIHFDDLQWERRYHGTEAYAQSKLANLMFAFELERRLRQGRFGAKSLAVHPGVARTNLFKIGSSTGLARVGERMVSGTVGLLLSSDKEGALPTLFAATSPEAQGGHYYGPQGFQEMRGGDVGPAEMSPAALDVNAQRKLWEVCEQLTGVGLESYHLR